MYTKYSLNTKRTESAPGKVKSVTGHELKSFEWAIKLKLFVGPCGIFVCCPLCNLTVVIVGSCLAL